MGTEILHSSVRRYTSPEEHAFFPDYIPDPIDELAKLQYPDNLLSEENGAASCCINDALLKRYVDEVIPAVCESGDDEQHGSSVLADVNVLQALSKRIHYGKFVAESKYRSDPEGYQKLVDNNDVDGVMKLLTNAAVEKKVLKRAKMKCATYGREPLVDALAEREGEDDEVRTLISNASAVHLDQDHNPVPSTLLNLSPLPPLVNRYRCCRRCSSRSGGCRDYEYRGKVE